MLKKVEQNTISALHKKDVLTLEELNEFLYEPMMDSDHVQFIATSWKIESDIFIGNISGYFYSKSDRGELGFLDSKTLYLTDSANDFIAVFSLILKYCYITGRSFNLVSGIATDPKTKEFSEGFNSAT